jgi:pimeloyl-ACP methyl ester carboxylesterase
MAFETIIGPDGVETEYFVVPFDQHGNCTGPATRDAVVTAAAGVTDIFLFCHGWNNDWGEATGRYKEFIDLYMQARHACWTPPDRPYRPLAVGLFWPSTALVAPWERAPHIAGGVVGGDDPQLRAELLALGDALPAGDAARLYELLDRDLLDPDGTAEVAALLAPVFDGPVDELGTAGTSAEDLRQVWTTKATGAAAPSSDTGTGLQDDDDAEGDEDDQSPPTQPATAGFGWLDPRNVIRAATVLLMKDRAGKVGGNGVATLLAALCAASGAPRVHLIGHSYGAKVLLTALCTVPAGTPRTDSVLLLQPAVSAFCFADKVPGNDRPGGYHDAPDRCREPVLTTFSKHDVPLTQLFHLAVRRASDLGEVVIAAGVPSRYAALGGFGPQGREQDTLVVDPVGVPALYELGAAHPRIIAIRGDDVIGGHGEVTNAATAWALLSQVRS